MTLEEKIKYKPEILTNYIELAIIKGSLQYHLRIVDVYGCTWWACCSSHTTTNTDTNLKVRIPYKE